MNEMIIKVVKREEFYEFFFLNKDGEEYIFSSEYLNPFDMAEEVQFALVNEMYDFGWRKYERSI